MYKLSIIIPIYNVEQYIKDTIESVLIQIRDDIEIVLVNDGSTDDSLNICRQYLNYPNIICLNKKNGGLSDARNYGIDNCQGKYILFLDGDDFLKENSLKSIIDTIDTHSTVDIIISNGMDLYFTEKGIVELKCEFEESKINYKCGNEVLEHFLDKPQFNNWSACANIYRKEFLIENSLYFKKGIFYEDAEWTPRVILASDKCLLINKSFYIYRQNRENSIMNSISLKKINDFIDIVIDKIDYVNEIDANLLLQEAVKKKYSKALVSILPKMYYLNNKDRIIIVEKINNMLYIFNYKKYNWIDKILGWKFTAYVDFLKGTYKTKIKQIVYSLKKIKYPTWR